MSIFRR